MVPLPEAVIAVLLPFAGLFSKPVGSHVQVLWAGAILCRGPHTVAAVLRVVGLGLEQWFEKYHRVLSRARWSGLLGAKILLGLLVPLLPREWPVVVGIDETIERRQGRKIKAKGRYRDAVRSTGKEVVKCYGLKWISLMLLVPLPWSTRAWGLPFLTVLAPSRRANTAAGRHHKTAIDWTLQLVKSVSRWLEQRAWVRVGDGIYACVRLARSCAAAARLVTLISRLRRDARLYAFPGAPVPHRRGPKPLKGKRCPALGQRLAEVYRRGKDVEGPWYGGTTRGIRLLSDCCLWYTPGEPPVAIRWVLVVDPTARYAPLAVFSTDLDLAPEQIVVWFVHRWNVVVSSEGHILQSVQGRPRLIDSGLVVWEAPWRESKTAEPSDNVLEREYRQSTRSQRAVNVAVASLHAIPVAETVYNARRQQGPTETSPIRRSSPAGYQRRYGTKEDVSTGEAPGARRRNLVEEVPPITVSGKWRRRRPGGGSGRSTVDRCAAKRAWREGPGPVCTPSVKVRQG